MQYEFYSEISIARDLSVFDFVSKGKKGSIRKRVIFMPTELPEVYNLAFGNIGKNGKIDDHSISNNGDRNKILATVAKVVEFYTNRYPERWIYFRGGTNGRTRLYRMAVGLNLEELSRKFDIYAEVDGREEFIPFLKNMPVTAFLVKKKIVI